MDMARGIACRICAHCEESICTKGQREPIDRKDDCWLFRNKNQRFGMAEPSQPDQEWRIW